MNEGENPFEISKGFDVPTPNHNPKDLDTSDGGHHTLGLKAGQSAPGTTVQAIITALKEGAFGRIGDLVKNDTTVETDVWLQADGRVLNKSDYPEAFAIYGNTYGGNGVTTFAIPTVAGSFVRIKLGLNL